MKRFLACLLILAMALLAGCAGTDGTEPTVSTSTPQVLTRVSQYSAAGSLLEQYQLEYDESGLLVQVTAGIRSDEKVTQPVSGAALPPGAAAVAENTLVLPDSAGTTLWALPLGTVTDQTEQNGRLTKITCADSGYFALFYDKLSAAATAAVVSAGYAVTENSDYYGYDAVLAALRQGVAAMESTDRNTLDDSFFSYLYQSEPNKGNIGYAFVDLDHNGVYELAVGSREPFSQFMLYDLYAIYNGRIVNVLSSGTNARHFLSTGDLILYEGSTAEGAKLFAAFDYYNSSLRLREAVISESDTWYRTTQDPSDPDTYEPVTMPEATAIRESYIVQEIDFTPISEFDPAS